MHLGRFRPLAVRLTVIRYILFVFAVDSRSYCGRIPLAKRFYLEIGILLHCGVTAFQYFFVAVTFVNTVRNQNARIRPTRRTVHEIHIKIDAALGGNLTEFSVFPLSVDHIGNVFPCERGEIEKIRRCIAEDLRVARPAVPLTRGTIGRYVCVIVFCRPARCFHKFVQKFVTTVE